MNKQPRILSGLCAASLMTVLAFAAGGCEDGVFEDAGEEVDEVVDETEDAVEDAGDEIKDAGDEIEDAVDDRDRSPTTP